MVAAVQPSVICVKLLYDRPQTKLREGNVFTRVCQSFCLLGGGLYGQNPPCTVTRGRYAPYWNAFLLINASYFYQLFDFSPASLVQ